MITLITEIEKLSKHFTPEQAKPLKELFLGTLKEVEQQRKAREDFSELKAIVNELAQAQKRTEQRIEELTQAQKKTEERLERLEAVVEELTQAQKRTEQRVNELVQAQKKTEERVNELAQAQKQTEERVGRLETVVEELAQAQKRTEQRVEELAQAQKRTEKRVDELAQAQTRTEEELRKLTIGVKNLQKEFGGLSHTVGYHLEDRAIRDLPRILKNQLTIDLTLCERRLMKIQGREVQINIYGEGKRNGEEIVIAGEAKTDLSLKEVDRFLLLVERIKAEVGKEVLPLFVCYSAKPKVKAYAEGKGAKVYFSYEFSI